MNSIFYSQKRGRNIKKLIEKFGYVSFDVFDTLIKRNVKKPTDLYKFIGFEVYRKYGIRDFDKIRYNAEMKLYSINVNITIDDIYDEIERILPSCNKNELKKIEIDYELSYCQCNYIMKDIYDYAKSKGKKIIAISDMYLSKETIGYMLEKCGYEIDKIYVSCERKATKRTSKLFEVALKKEEIEKHEIIHIGDSFRADYLGARRAGIHAIKIDRNNLQFNVRRFKKYINNEEIYNVHNSIIDNNLSQCSSYYEKFGFAVLGPALFSFCKWIEKRCIECEIEKVFFFSRDGYIMKKVFDILTDGSIKSEYLCVSRRALRVPYNARHFQIDDILKLLPNTKQIKVKSIFEYLGLDIIQYTDLLKELNVKTDTIIYNRDLNDRYRSIIEAVLPEYKRKAEEELNNAIAYLKQEKVFGKLAVVDIGWHNSMQYCMECILNECGMNNNVYGLYFGLQDGGFNVKNAEGFIRERDESQYVNSVSAYIGLIESFFLEQKGTTLKYEYKDSRYFPVREEYEYEIYSTEYQAYGEMQKGILQYINVIKRIENCDDLVLNGIDAFAPINSFGINPYMKDVNKFDTFRYFSEEICYLVGYKGFFYYLLHIKALKNDLYNARWKVGFLKKILKVNLPYYNIYNKLKKKA